MQNRLLLYDHQFLCKAGEGLGSSPYEAPDLTRRPEGEGAKQTYLTGALVDAMHRKDMPFEVRYGSLDLHAQAVVTRLAV